MLYSKNGSYPYPYTDGTDGWIEVPDMPDAPAGKEVVWWFPPGWVIRDPQPPAEDGYVWTWSQSEEKWNKYPVSPAPAPAPAPAPPPSPNGTISILGNVTGG